MEKAAGGEGALPYHLHQSSLTSNGCFCTGQGGISATDPLSRPSVDADPNYALFSVACGIVCSSYDNDYSGITHGVGDSAVLRWHSGPLATYPKFEFHIIN